MYEIYILKKNHVILLFPIKHEVNCQDYRHAANNFSLKWPKKTVSLDIRFRGDSHTS